MRQQASLDSSRLPKNEEPLDETTSADHPDLMGGLPPTPEEEVCQIEGVEVADELVREARLSDRERQVVLAVAQGMTRAEAARELGIAAADARRHVLSARPKLAEAARRLGLRR